MRLGADVDELGRLSGDLDAAARRLEAWIDIVGHQAGSAWWRGTEADRFRHHWARADRPVLTDLSLRLQELATRIRGEIGQQRAASSGGTGAGPGARMQMSPRARLATDRIRGWLDTGGFGVTKSDLEKIRDELAALDPADRSAVILALTEEERGVLWDQIRESPGLRGRLGGFSQQELAAFYRAVAPGLSPEALDELLHHDALGAAQDHGRYGLEAQSATEAIAHPLAATHRDGPAEYEIEIRRLDSGAWVVVLPGVVDLTDGLPSAPEAILGVAGGATGVAAVAGGMVSEWHGENADDSPRDMYYAAGAATGSGDGSITYENGYAFMVKAAMRKAGVPEGAQVMLVGHSFGAYTALELAADPEFNGSGRYSVSNVVAAGADVDWLAADHALPSTDVLVLNNANDAAFLAESVLSRDGAAASDVIFPGGNAGAGHDPANYADAVRAGYVEEYAGRLPPEFVSDGDRIRIGIRDPYRQAERWPW